MKPPEEPEEPMMTEDMMAMMMEKMMEEKMSEKAKEEDKPAEDMGEAPAMDEMAPEAMADGEAA